MWLEKASRFISYINVLTSHVLSKHPKFSIFATLDTWQHYCNVLVHNIFIQIRKMDMSFVRKPISQSGGNIIPDRRAY
jgi:hypothetical protein